MLQPNEKPQVTMVGLSTLQSSTLGACTSELFVVILQVGWDKTDRYLTTAFTPDCIVRVWDATNGQLLRKLKVRKSVQPLTVEKGSSLT